MTDPNRHVSAGTSITINGVRWCVQLLRRYPRGWRKKEQHGFAEPDIRRLRIVETQTPRELLITIIHEVRHAQNWDLAEEAVEREATELADVLIALGYRRG